VLHNHQRFKSLPKNNQFEEKVNNAEQEDNNRDLVDAMHHPDVDVAGSFGVFSPEEITEDFVYLKEFAKAASPGRGRIFFIGRHNQSTGI